LYEILDLDISKMTLSGIWDFNPFVKSSHRPVWVYQSF
jgi:hypothetical protein